MQTCVLTVDLGRLNENLRILSLIVGTKLLVAVVADAYGHGIEAVGR